MRESEAHGTGVRQAESQEIQRLLGEAVRNHKSGRLEEAKQFYLQVLAIDVQHAKSLYGIALIAFQTGNLEAAVRMMQRAIAASPKEAMYRFSLGTVLQAQRKPDEALAEYEYALLLNPEQEEAHFHAADILREQGKLAAAEQHYRRALVLRPDYAETHQNLGIVFRRLGKLTDARASFEHAIALNPGNAASFHNLGSVLFAGGDVSEARAAFERALELAPDLVEARCGLGAALEQQERLDEAEACFVQALAAKPEYAEAHCNLGNLARKRGQLEDAKLHYESALGFSPDLPEAHSNLGMILQTQCRLDEARVHYDRALAAEPGFADARWNRCLLDLLEGRFASGWKDYEVRYLRWKSAPRRFPGPLWRGEPLQGERILLHSEQGLGDSLQFLRFLPMVQAAGGTVLLDVQAPLRRLAAESFDVTVLDDREKAQPSFEWQCPLMGLPFAFRTTLDSIPRQMPYLAIPQTSLDAAEQFDWPVGGLRVGIVWSGSPHHQEDRYRSIPLSFFEPLLHLQGVRFFSLQLGPAASQREGEQSPITDLQHAIHDMADTAALISHLDLILTVDTAVAHLAGALAKRTWVLLPFAPDWRWLTEGDGSPWYPTMRLFRQPGILDWQSVMDRVRFELAALAQADSLHTQ